MLLHSEFLLQFSRGKMASDPKLFRMKISTINWFMIIIMALQKLKPNGEYNKCFPAFKKIQPTALLNLQYHSALPVVPPTFPVNYQNHKAFPPARR